MKKDMLPALFIGHGSPMNIIRDNQFTRDMEKLADNLPVPDAVVVVSAHWLTRGTFITSGPSPEQIYDFHGFPAALYDIKYRPPGSPVTADIVSQTGGQDIILHDNDRGIDHAAWSVLNHIFPAGKIPVLELSLDISRKPDHHFELGKKLIELRSKNILVIGSGNIIHNLSEIDFDDNASPYEWAIEFDRQVKSCIEKRDYSSLIDYRVIGNSASRAIPYFDHYLPLLYILGMTRDTDNVRFIHESIQNGSISMRCFIVE